MLPLLKPKSFAGFSVLQAYKASNCIGPVIMGDVLASSVTVNGSRAEHHVPGAF